MVSCLLDSSTKRKREQGVFLKVDRRQRGLAPCVFMLAHGAQRATPGRASGKLTVRVSRRAAIHQPSPVVSQRSGDRILELSTLADFQVEGYNRCRGLKRPTAAGAL